MEGTRGGGGLCAQRLRGWYLLLTKKTNDLGSKFSFGMVGRANKKKRYLQGSRGGRGATKTGGIARGGKLR